MKVDSARGAMRTCRLGGAPGRRTQSVLSPDSSCFRWMTSGNS